MPIHVNIPSTIKADGPDVFSDLDWIDTKLATALKVAVRQAKPAVATLLEELERPEGGLSTHAPVAFWTGPGSNQVDDAKRAAANARISSVLDAVIADQNLPEKNQRAFSTRWQHGKRSWIVLDPPVWARVKVRDYIDYLLGLSASSSIRDSLLDILHEVRLLTVWVVKVKAAVTSSTLIDEVQSRMNNKDPLKSGETTLWGWSNFDRQREAVVRMDRSSNASQIPPLDAPNSTIVGGGNDAALLPGAKLMVTRMKVPELPALNISVPLPEFLQLLRKQMLGDDNVQRKDAIGWLIDIRRHPGVLQILQEGLDQGISGSIDDYAKTTIRTAIIEALSTVPNRPYSIALLLLYGVGHPVEWTARGEFIEWFKQGGGRECLEFLELVLTQESAPNKAKAAKVLLFLLDFSRMDEARSYPGNVTRLKKLTARLDIFGGGVLGVESNQQLIGSQAMVLDSLRKLVQDAVNRSPSGDPHKTANVLQLDAMGKALQTIEDDVANFDLTQLEELRARLGRMLVSGNYVLERVEGIHSGIQSIYDSLPSSIETAETKVLFELRRDYVAGWAGGISDAEFRAKIDDVDFRGENFLTEVGTVKWVRAKKDFQSVVNDIHGHRLITGFGGSDVVNDDTFHAIRATVRNEQQKISETLQQVSGFFGGNRVTLIDETGRKGGAGIHGFDEASKLETDVAIFRLHTAMFAHVSIATQLNHAIFAHSIGSSDFRREQSRKLTTIINNIAEDFEKGRFQKFIDRDASTRATFAEVERKIQAEVRSDIFLEVILTIVTAILTVGVGAIVRLALIGRTVGILRTARAVETIVILSEASVLTGIQLGTQKLIFGKKITLTDVATTAVQNLAFVSGFRLLGKYTARLFEKGAWGFVAGHTIGAVGMAGAGALAQKIQTGEWPSDMKTFLLHSVGSYILFMWTAKTTQSVLLNKTQIGARMRSKVSTSAEKLVGDSMQLNKEYLSAVQKGTISEPRFNRMKTQIRENFKQVRELAKQLKNANLVDAEKFRKFDEYLVQLDAHIASMTFPKLPGYLTTGGQVRTLPPPQSISGLVGQGSTNTYRYNPNTNNAKLESALALYGKAGFDIIRLPGGIVHVKRADGRLTFVLDPGPLALPEPTSPAGLLPAGTNYRQPTLLERSLGQGYLDAAKTKTATDRLKKINRALLETLESEFTDTAALLSLRLFNRDHPHPWTFWKKDAIRGVAKMLSPQRGILFRPVQRLFENRTQAELTELFQKYNDNADKPGAERLVSDELTPSSSLALIRIYDKLRVARIQLPSNMTRKAVQGLLRIHNDGRDVVKELKKNDRLDKRLAQLEAESPIVDPRIRPKGSREAEVLRAQQLDIRPGLNLLQGTPADVRVAIEALGSSSGGKLHDVAVRNELEKLITSYRDLVVRFQSGVDNEPNVIGAREEFDTIIATIEAGGDIFAIGNIKAQPGRSMIRINLNLAPLPATLNIVNAPTAEELQLDVGATFGGQMLVIEATTGRLALPSAWKGMDPQSSASKTLDFSKLNDSHEHRKIKQAIKMLAAADIAHKLGSQKGPFPKIVFRVGRAEADAKRALNFIGIEVVETNPKP